MSGRHIDSMARMLWLTLRKRDGQTVAGLVDYWRPTFSVKEVRDALERLEANGFARRVVARSGECTWSVGAPALPGEAVEGRRATA